MSSGTMDRILRLSSCSEISCPCGGFAGTHRACSVVHKVGWLVDTGKQLPDPTEQARWGLRIQILFERCITDKLFLNTS